MPRSNTWPGGSDQETATGVDSAGSCDSVVSATSAFSDDSLEYLSAEEKACLMFLEETIESLDAEDDSGLSNDELEISSNPGNNGVNISAQKSRSQVNGLQTHHSMDPIKEHVETKPKLSYMVPTPFAQASSSVGPVPRPKVGFLLDRNPSFKPSLAPSSIKPSPLQSKPEVPLEVNVLIQPPTKPKDVSFRTTEGATPRGPLSYDALVHLQRSASTKKTPLCPTVDHTIDSDKKPPAVMESRRYGRIDRTNAEASRFVAAPPAVAPKPKAVPVQEKDLTVTSRPSFCLKKASDPNTVRREALQKLGLLKDDENPPPLPLISDDRSSKVWSNSNPSRAPSFCSSQEPKARLLQSSASFHHTPRGEQQPVASNGVLHHRQKSSSLERSTSQYNSRNYNESRFVKTAEPIQTTPPASSTQRPSDAVGYSVMIVPGMGADRKEALRKLGLLKE